jgi:hypothetical protein
MLSFVDWIKRVHGSRRHDVIVSTWVGYTIREKSVGFGQHQWRLEPLNSLQVLRDLDHD